MPETFRGTLRALSAARNRIAHKAFEKHDHERAVELVETLPREVLEGVPKDEYADAPTRAVTFAYFGRSWRS